MSSKTKFTSKLGVIAATVGSAVGLGTVWRFPNEVQSNGGSAFLITYVICVLLMGIPVMLAEFSLGRGSRADSVNAFRKLTPNTKWWFVGALAVLVSYLILGFYIVVSGWTLEYLWLSLSGDLFAGINGDTNSVENFTAVMKDAMLSGWKPIFWTALMLLLNLWILIRGVEKGIEKMANTLMPILFLILVIFCAFSLSLPNSMEGVEYFLKPDFSKIDINVIVSAVGQAFFSLSLGMGILITYSAYYPKSTKLTRTSFTVSGLVLMIALLVGLIIFPAIKSLGINGQTQGVALIFVTLPEMFMQMPAPTLWAVLFFFLLVVTALTSTVSLGEVNIAFISEWLKCSRKKAALIVILPLFVFNAVCSLSLGPWEHIRIIGMTIFDALDYFTSNIMLPIVAIFVCIYVGHKLPKSYLYNEMTNYGKMKSLLMPAVLFAIRFIAPILIATVLVSKIIEVL